LLLLQALWTLVSDKCRWTPRQGHAATVFKGDIYIFGGFDESGYCNDAYIWPLENSTSDGVTPVSLDGVFSRGSSGKMDAEGAEKEDSSKPPKILTVSLECIMDSIHTLKHNRNSYDRIIRGIVAVLSVVSNAVNFRHQAAASSPRSTANRSGANSLTSSHARDNAAAEINQWDDSVVTTVAVLKDNSVHDNVFKLVNGSCLQRQQRSGDNLAHAYKMSKVGSPFRENFIDQVSVNNFTSSRSAKSREDFQDLSWQGSHQFLPDGSNTEDRCLSSAALKENMEQDMKKLRSLQHKIRQAAENDQVELMESLCQTRTELAVRASGQVEQLSDYISRILAFQESRQEFMNHIIAQLEEIATSFSGIDDDNAFKDLLDAVNVPDFTSWEQWEGILRDSGAIVRMLDDVSFETEGAILTLSQAMKRTADVSNLASTWLYSSTSYALPPLDRPRSVSENIHQLADDRVESARLMVLGKEEYMSICEEMQNSVNVQDKNRMNVKVAVDAELDKISTCEKSAMAFLVNCIRSAQGLLKHLLSQNSTDMSSVLSLQQEIDDWREKVNQLKDIENLKIKCDELISGNAVLEDSLLKLEDAKIDCKSNYDKAVLKSNRRKVYPTALIRASSRGTRPESPVVGSPSITSTMLSYLSLSSSDHTAATAVDAAAMPLPVGASSGSTQFTASQLQKHPSDEQGVDIQTLKELSLEADKAAARARRGLRSWYRSNRKYAMEIAPELFHYLPDLRSPGSVLGDGGFAQSAHLPTRRLDEYDEISPLHPGGFASATGSSVGGGNPAAAQSAAEPSMINLSGRHLLLKAVYEGEDVVLKGFVMTSSDQRRGFQRETRILSKLKSSCIITPEAIVEGSSDVQDHSWQQMLFLHYPYLKGGDLSVWMKAAPRKPWELQQMARQILYAIIYLHDHGIIHRVSCHPL
jgi:hypothetical protein